MKRFLYRFCIFMVFVVSLPIQALIALCIAMLNGFPVLFRQKRVGLGGAPFLMYKFRTMRVGSEREQKKLKGKNEAHGPVFKIHDDPRYTPIGRLLAHTGLDELPQLFNVLRGDMALFGPRPLPVAEAQKLTGWQKKRHAIKPGIISPWIVNGYHAQSFDAWMRSDITYIKEKNLRYDLSLAVQTVKLLARLMARELGI